MVAAKKRFKRIAHGAGNPRRGLPEQWPPLEGLPTLAEAMKDAASIPAPVEAVGIIRKDEENRLY